jgi:RHS repeat-associated protein
LHLPNAIATDDGLVWSYNATDGLGSIRQQLDASGIVESVNSYRPFGLPLEGDGGDPYGFTGEWWTGNEESGMLFLRARYYEPYLNRFISPDTIIPDFWNPQNLNRYSYALNNAVNYTDPNGHCPPGVPECRDEQGRPIDAYYIQCPYTDPACNIPRGKPDPETWDILQARGYPIGNTLPFCVVASLDRRTEELVKHYASQYGVPWQVVAGVLKSEIELDTGWEDFFDTLFSASVPRIALRFRANPGPGIGNVHLFSARHVSHYLSERYPGRNYLTLSGRPLNEYDDATIIRSLASNEFNVEAVSAFVRQLADFRFGINGQPHLGNHSDLSEWTLTDAAVVWHGYRYGVPNVSLEGYGLGFENTEDFQDRSYTWSRGLQESPAIFIGTGAENSIRGAIPFLRCYLAKCDQ